MIPVGRYLPGVIPAGGKITIRELLQHRSGLANYTGHPSRTRAKQSPSIRQLDTPRFAASQAPALRSGNAVGLLQRQRMIPPVVRAAGGQQVEVCSNRLTETAWPLAGLPFRSQGPFSPAAGCRNRSRRTRMINLHARPRQSSEFASRSESEAICALTSSGSADVSESAPRARLLRSREPRRAA
jgi:hypothetical protein